MNFSPEVKAWLMLITLVLSTGLAAGYTAFLTGSNPWGAAVVGLGTAATNVYHALSQSPKDKMKGQTNPPV